MKIWCKIKRKFINSKDFFRYDIPRGVKNLITWFPVVWKDRNWDQYYIYVVLHKKLSLMEKGLRNGYNVNADEEADKVKKCVLILDRLIKDEYHEHAFKRHDEIWGPPELKFQDIEGDSEHKTLNIEHKNVKTKKDEELERKDFKRACEHENELKKQDLDILFRTMRKHIQGWWD